MEKTNIKVATWVRNVDACAQKDNDSPMESQENFDTNNERGYF